MLLILFLKVLRGTVKYEYSKLILWLIVRFDSICRKKENKQSILSYFLASLLKFRNFIHLIAYSKSRSYKKCKEVRMNNTWDVVRPRRSLKIYVLTATDGRLSELERRTTSGNSALSYLSAWPDACHGRKRRWTIHATPDIKTGTTQRSTSPRNRNYFSWSARGHRGGFPLSGIRESEIKRHVHPEYAWYN